MAAVATHRLGLVVRRLKKLSSPGGRGGNLSPSAPCSPFLLRASSSSSASTATTSTTTCPQRVSAPGLVALPRGRAALRRRGGLPSEGSKNSTTFFFNPAPDRRRRTLRLFSSAAGGDRPTPSPSSSVPYAITADDDSSSDDVRESWYDDGGAEEEEEEDPEPQLPPASASTAPRVRLSRLISSHGLNMQMSRRSADRLIVDEMVTVAGRVVTDPGYALTLEEAGSGGGVIKVAGRRLMLPSSSSEVDSSEEKSSSASRSSPSAAAAASQPSAGGGGVGPSLITRVWLAHKVPGEVVAENDPYGRPSLLERLKRGGVGKAKKKKKNQNSFQAAHLKPVGRLDMMTEGLIVITNDGRYAREMELPATGLHRTYRVRVHGRITSQKLKAMRSGLEVDGVSYRGMKVNIEAGSSGGGMRRRERASNTWLRITCVEGKNRMIRKVMDHLGLTVTRLIRTSFGDYDLFSIPPGMAIEVPVKPVKEQKKRGRLRERRVREKRQKPVEIDGERIQPVQWIRHT